MSQRTAKTDRIPFPNLLLLPSKRDQMTILHRLLIMLVNWLNKQKNEITMRDYSQRSKQADQVSFLSVAFTPCFLLLALSSPFRLFSCPVFLAISSLLFSLSLFLSFIFPLVFVASVIFFCLVFFVLFCLVLFCFCQLPRGMCSECADILLTGSFFFFEFSSLSFIYLCFLLVFRASFFPVQLVSHPVSRGRCFPPYRLKKVAHGSGRIIELHGRPMFMKQLRFVCYPIPTFSQSRAHRHVFALALVRLSSRVS